MTTETEVRWVWWIDPKTGEPHAFPVGPGWTRSVCGSTRWSVLLQMLTPEVTDRCPSCVTRTREEAA